MDNTNVRQKEGTRITFIGMIVNGILMVLKLVLGIIGNSAALVADAIHSLSDFISDIVVIVGFRYTSKPADKNHNYGHGKIETISAVFIGLILIMISFSLFKSSALDIYNFYFNDLEIEVPKTFVLIAVVASIIFKELMFRYTLKVGKKLSSEALIANAWHQRSDSLSSIAAFVGILLAILLGPNFAVMDPIASLVVSIFVFKVGVEIILSSYHQLVDAALTEEEINKIEEIIRSLNAIKGFKNIKTRRIGYYVSIDVHIFVEKDLDVIQSHDIASHLEELLIEEFGEDTFVSVHVEPYLEKEK